MDTQSLSSSPSPLASGEHQLAYVPVSVELVDHMGSDISVVNAARVSFSKISALGHGDSLPERDAKLINFLAKHDHWSPFGHAFASFRIKASIPVARQLVKHSVGLCWNEISRRYVSFEPEVYAVDAWRGRPANVKQGSGGEPNMPQSEVAALYKEVCDRSVEVYNQMVANGVAPEQARLVLPQAAMTEWIWSGSLAAFARVCKLRCAKDTQIESQQVANGIAEHMRELFPVSFGALLEHWLK